MKKFLLVIFAGIFLASCQNQNPIPPQNPAPQAEQSVSGSISETKTETLAPAENLDFPEFKEKFGTKIALEKDFCLADLCIKKDQPIYQISDGNIVQFALFVDEEIPGQTDEDGNPATKSKFVKYVEAKLRESAPDEKSEDFIKEHETSYFELSDNMSSEEFEKNGYYYETIVANPRKNTISSEKNVGLSIEGKNYTSLGENIVAKISSRAGCASSVHEQKFFDKNGTEITNLSEIFTNIPKEITINGIKLVFDENSTKNFDHRAFIPGYSETSTKLVEWDISLTENIESQFLKENIIGTSDVYGFSFVEFPNVIFAYKNTNPRADYYLTGSLANISTNEKWEVSSTEDTIKIFEETEQIQTIWDYEAKKETGKAIYIRPKNEKDNYKGINLADIKAENSPLLRLQKLPNGDALAFVNEKFESFTTAELCKPLVYVYDKNSRENSLTIDLPQGGEFTKLIPHFSHGNTWDFVADIRSQIASEKQNLDYLYYSVRVPNYTFNRDWWQVFGRDIEKFFDEKLDYIGFNATEKKDFIDFWKTEFDENQLYFVSFKFDEKLDEWAKLKFKESPKTQMRVLLEAFPINKTPNPHFLYPTASKIFDKKILKTFVRSGEFDVFEWGGVVQKNSKEPIIVK